MARPKAEINWKRVDQMLMSQCDGVQISEVLGISPETLYRACQREHKMGFDAYSQQKRAKGVAVAKEKFYQQCWIDNNDGQQATRQIFWLKNHAQMADKQEVKHAGEIQNNCVIVKLPKNGREPD